MRRPWHCSARAALQMVCRRPLFVTPRRPHPPCHPVTQMLVGQQHAPPPPPHNMLYHTTQWPRPDGNGWATRWSAPPPRIPRRRALCDPHRIRQRSARRRTRPAAPPTPSRHLPLTHSQPARRYHERWRHPSRCMEGRRHPSRDSSPHRPSRRAKVEEEVAIDIKEGGEVVVTHEMEVVMAVARQSRCNLPCEIVCMRIGLASHLRSPRRRPIHIVALQHRPTNQVGVSPTPRAPPLPPPPPRLPLR